MHPTDGLGRRQIWAEPTITSASFPSHCTPFHLPSNGLIVIDSTSVITLSQNAIFKPECTTLSATIENDTALTSPLIDLRDPFYVSTSPQIFAIATATVISWMLVIMLLITPRTFYVRGSGGGRFLRRRGMISGENSIIGVGGRPLLQKLATILVAISLTIATTSTFKIAEQQYNDGYQDATALTDDVVGGTELRIIRVVSDTFLWLAQIQTLLRLFPRHREKVVIKWIGFALIILDTLFSILNSFVDDSLKSRPRSFTDAVPALSYLFELALSLLYAAWVLYYSLKKRQFAFYHVKMKNICLVAILSIIAIMIPVTFFVLDIAKPSLAGWGDYFRWVGAAAASVVVWEWVERIEALERDKMKEGVLGNEVYDGDEMLEVRPSVEGRWPGTHRLRSLASGISGGGSSAGRPGTSVTQSRTIRSRIPPPYIRNDQREPAKANQEPFHPSISGTDLRIEVNDDPGLPPPTAIASPVSRTDTTSAASTVYAVHYHPVSESSSPNPDTTAATIISPGQRAYNEAIAIRTQQARAHQGEREALGIGLPASSVPQLVNQASAHAQPNTPHRLYARNPFKRRRTTPPVEISHAVVVSSTLRESKQSGSESRKISMFGRLGTKRQDSLPEEPRPVRIIPAQPRANPWLYQLEGITPDTARAFRGPTNAYRSGPRPIQIDTTLRSSYVSGLPQPQSSQPASNNTPSTAPDTNVYQRGTLTISDPRGVRSSPQTHGPNTSPRDTVSVSPSISTVLESHSQSPVGGSPRTSQGVGAPDAISNDFSAIPDMHSRRSP
ncbi:pH-response regulator protein palH/rim21 [Ptychographa xylographoides]|nr:pH-response regulator protein palH/rim21 [Ptychographa xylographoides]